MQRMRLAQRIGLKGSPLIPILASGLIAACAAPSREPPYYEPPSSSAAPFQPATIEGSAQAVTDSRTMFERPYLAICAYVFAVDGRIVASPSDCGAAILVSPGKHTIVVAVDGYRYDKGRPIILRATTTLTFEAAEDHRYKVSLGRASFISFQVRADVWISDETTRTAVTETRLATMPAGPIGSGGVGLEGL
jgi:hypothetical protein